MAVTLINGSVLFPHPADWSSPVEWQRAWQSSVTAAITGDESRSALRAAAREQIAFTISCVSPEERAELDQRLDAASLSGLACAPFWGRGSTLASAANSGATSLSLTDSTSTGGALSAASFAAGDYAFLFLPSQAEGQPSWSFDCIQIASVSPGSLSLSSPISQSYPAGSVVWPVLFGKFKMQNAGAATSWHEAVKLTISELTPRHQPVVGSNPGPSGSGVGTWQIGSTFVVS